MIKKAPIQSPTPLRGSEQLNMQNKVVELDYFRKIKRFFAYVDRGSKRDLIRIQRELDNDIKSNMWKRSDPMHLINLKNNFD